MSEKVITQDDVNVHPTGEECWELGNKCNFGEACQFFVDRRPPLVMDGYTFGEAVIWDHLSWR